MNGSLANDAKTSGDKNAIRLVNFNLQQNNAHLNVSKVQQTRQLRRKPSLRLSTATDYKPRTARSSHLNKSSRASLHSNSSNGSSASSSSSSCSDADFHTDSRITHIFSPQFVQHLKLNQLEAETSTPLASSSLIANCQQQSMSAMPFLINDQHEDKQTPSCCYCEQCHECVSNQAINMALFMDQSTQVS